METKKQSQNSWFDWRVIVGIAAIYSLNALLLGTLDLGKLVFGHGEVRIFIFIPALGSLMFGPVSGGLGAGLGNLLNDIIDDVILSGQALDLGNFVGFVGNLVGAFFTGLFGRRITIGKDQSFYEKDMVLMYIQNILASIFGMAVITGEIIGVGLLLVGSVPSLEVGFTVAGGIITANGYFLLLTMLPIQLAMVIWQRRQKKEFIKQLLEYSRFTLEAPVDRSPVQILDFSGSGDGLIKDQWVTAKLVLKNISRLPMRYRLEIRSQDRIDPSVTYTQLLQPDQTDDVFFQVLPFDDETRELELTVRPWVEESRDFQAFTNEENQTTYRFTYKVLTSESDRLRMLTSFIVVLAFLAAAAQGVKAIIGEITPSSLLPTILVGVFAIVELIFAVVYYKIKANRLAIHDAERVSIHTAGPTDQRLELIESDQETVEAFRDQYPVFSPEAVDVNVETVLVSPEDPVDDAITDELPPPAEPNDEDISSDQDTPFDDEPEGGIPRE